MQTSAPETQAWTTDTRPFCVPALLLQPSLPHCSHRSFPLLQTGLHPSRRGDWAKALKAHSGEYTTMKVRDFPHVPLVRREAAPRAGSARRHESRCAGSSSPSSSPLSPPAPQPVVAALVNDLKDGKLRPQDCFVLERYAQERNKRSFQSSHLLALTAQHSTPSFARSHLALYFACTQTYTSVCHEPVAVCHTSFEVRCL
jgi:hypothetical protein